MIVRGLAHSYGAIEALRGLDATFGPGKVTAILGPNGAGKSTLLRCLVGALRPSRGEVLLDGVPLRGLGRRRRAARLGYVAQRPLFSAGLSVREVVELGRLARPPAAGRVAAALELMRIADLAERPVTRLSVGQAQRVALARAWAQVEPDGWLIMDEPAAALDPAHVRLVVELARRFATDGGAVVSTVHDVQVAAAMADEALLLSDGVAAAHGPASEVLVPSRLAEVFHVGFARFASAEGAELVAPELTPGGR